MTSHLPNATPWSGSVLASGFVFDEALLDRGELVRRLLAVWTDRARLGRAGPRWYLVGLTPRRVDTRVCIGAPLVLCDGRWLMGPITPETLRATPMDAVLECVAGQPRTTGFASLTQVHPSELIELPLPPVLPVELLAPPPQPVVLKRPEAPTLEAVFSQMLSHLALTAPAAPVAAAPPPRPSLRARLGAWLEARRAARADRAARREAAAPGVAARVGSWFSSLFAAGPTRSALPPPEREELDVRRIRRPPDAPGAPSWFDRLSGWFASGEPRPEAASPPRVAPPGWLDRLGRWLTPTTPPTPPRDPPPRLPPARAAQPGWLATAFRSLFSKKQEDKQREYLDDLRRRFELGDLAEALRRALPLGGTGGITGGLASIPAPRTELSLFGASSIGGPSMVMPNDEYAAMRKLYRDSADALVAKGQIEEAAYVLAKLLHDGAAAVALLEKHGKLELAAQLATAQHLSEVERIRLWLLAGRKDEAIRIARGSNDFGALVAALSSRAPELARQLRSVWGEFLADRRRYTEAIVVTAALPEVPATWDTWVARSLEAGGASAVTALAVDSWRHPEHAQYTRSWLAELLANDEPARLTTTAAEAFLKHAPQASGPLYRDLWRRLMRGASSGHRVDHKLADRVLKATGDQTLVVDAVMSAAQPDRRVREPLQLPAPVVPSLPVLDVAPLPKGRRVIAHGAAGLRIVSANGETLRHHLVKADQLVAGPIGVQVLVLSLDGSLTRVWKLDPSSLELTSWFQANVSAASRRYDGLCWGVGMEDSLVFLDPSAATPMEWWRVPNIECREIDAGGSRVIALATDRALRESWRYVFDAASEKLQVRYGPDVDCWVRGEAVVPVPWELKLREDAVWGLKIGTSVVVTLSAAAPWNTFAMGAGLVLTRVTEGDTEVRLAPWTDGGPFVVARLQGTREVRCRDLSVDRLALCDEHGRVTELDLA